MKESELGHVTERSGNGLVGPDTSDPRSHHKSENDSPVTARQAVYKSHTLTCSCTELYIRYIYKFYTKITPRNMDAKAAIKLAY